MLVLKFTGLDYVGRGRCLLVRTENGETRLVRGYGRVSPFMKPSALRRSTVRLQPRADRFRPREDRRRRSDAGGRGSYRSVDESAADIDPWARAGFGGAQPVVLAMSRSVALPPVGTHRTAAPSVSLGWF